MKNLIGTLLFLVVIRCNFGDEIKKYVVNIPKGVSNIEQYKNNICEFAAREQGR